MRDRETIDAAVSRALGRAFRAESVQTLGGGCIHRALRVADGQGAVFVKQNNRSFRDAFEAEALALGQIAETETLRVPRALAVVDGEEASYLVLEYIEPRPSRGGDWRALGHQLAALHAIRQPRFGWGRDNLIGATPQPNPQADDWAEFFRVHRLEHQIRLNRDKGFAPRAAAQLLDSVGALLAGHAPWPSLLHGDLWSGNVAFDAGGAPFVFDPASYCGDREADLAFTEFFGGFPPAFYEAYRDALPLDSGYERRKTLYNLYHCLNHAYLFGGGYASEAERMILDLQ